MDLRITDDEVTIVLRDDVARELGRALTAAVGTAIAGTAGTGSPLVGLWRGNVDALRELVERLSPAVDELDQESAGRAAAVRAAIRNRLRRRTG